MNGKGIEERAAFVTSSNIPQAGEEIGSTVLVEDSEKRLELPPGHSNGSTGRDWRGSVQKLLKRLESKATARHNPAARLLMLVCVIAAGSPLDALADIYYIRSDAPDDAGVPDGDPDTPGDCWQTVQQAFDDLQSNESGTLVGKGNFFIRIRDLGATYVGPTTAPLLLISGLTTSVSDTLTVDNYPGETPTLDGENGQDTIQVSTVSNVTIKGFNFAATESSGNMVQITGTNDANRADNVKVQQCTALGTSGGSAVSLSYADNCEISDFTNLSSVTARGIIAWNTTNCQLLRNTIHDCTNGGSGIGILIGASTAANVTVDGNKIYSNNWGIYIFDGPGHIMRNNIVYDNVNDGIGMGGGGTTIPGPKMINNTIYSNAEGIGLYGGGGAVFDAKIYNNIFKDNSSVGVWVDTTDESGFDSDYNVFDNNTNGVARWNGANRATVSDWKTVADADLSPNTIEDNSIEADPVFIDPNGDDDVLGGSNGVDDNFALGNLDLDDAKRAASGSTGTVVQVTGGGLTASAWVDAQIVFITGALGGETRTITANTATSITVGSSFSATPDAGDRFVVHSQCVDTGADTVFDADVPTVDYDGVARPGDGLDFDSVAAHDIGAYEETDVYPAAGFTIVESGGSTSVAESGTTDTFTVVLDAEPGSNVVILVSSGDTGEATVNVSSLTFIPAAWNTAQTVTVTGVDDNLIDGNQNITITLSIDDANSDDNFDPLANQTVSATTTDDDVAGFTIVESGGSTSVAESGTTDTFTVVLDAEPDSNVVILVSSGDTGEATVNVASLTFIPASWNTAQTVTVTGVDDNLIDGNQNTTITLSIDDANSDDNFDSLANQTVSATTTDDDVAGFTIVESGGSTSVAESGTTDTFTVVLDAEPDSNVVILVSSGDTGEATVNVASLTFIPAAWNTAQTVTVTGVDDNLIDGSQNTTITLSIDDANSDDNFDPLANQTVSATTTDDDVAGFTIVESGGSTSVAESGTTDTFTVVLDAESDSNVVILVSSGDTGEATVNVASLTFIPAAWNTAQTVTVTGVDDNLIDGSQNTTITLSVDDANSDDNFDPLANQTVSATTTDDDVAGFTIIESGGSTSVAESATTDTFTVVLDAEPDSNVAILVSSGDTGEATVNVSSLTFIPAAWNTAQTVTVTGVDDNLIDGNQNTTITLSIDDINSDDNFDPLANQTVSATTTDDDVAGFTIVESGGSTSVAESGTTDTFTVVLDAEPDSNVVILVSSGDTGEATVNVASLTFIPASWNTAQTVTVTGVDDNLIDGNQNTTITLSIDDANSDDNFDPLASARPETGVFRTVIC